MRAFSRVFNKCLELRVIINSCLADEKVPVQSTNIPYHLEQMLDILEHEEDDQTSGGTTVIKK